MRLGATLYVKNSLEAVELYKEAFGLTLGFGDMTPVKYPDGTYIHAPLFRNGREIFAVSEESRNDRLMQILTASDQRPITSCGINFDSEDGVRKAFQMLSDAGRVIEPLKSEPWSSCCGEVVDKYGVDWFVCRMDD